MKQVLTSTNSATPLYKHELMRLVATMDSCKRRERKELLSSRSIASKVLGACPSEAQAQGSLSETHSWTVTQSGNKRGVKREATITAGLRPRSLRTYARPAPVNRAKGARLSWTVATGLTSWRLTKRKRLKASLGRMRSR